MTTTIRVELVVSVEVSSGWPGKSSIEQVYKEGTGEAISKVRRILGETNSIRIVSVKGAEMTTKVS